jgi:protein SCO1/2
MLRTIIASVWVILLGWGAASWMTDNFQVWTEEGARRLRVAVHPVAIPPVHIEGPNIAPTTLPALLRQENSVTIANFIYTRCQAVCLSLSAVFQQMQTTLLNDTDSHYPTNVQLLSISFDHKRDDLPALQDYADNLSAQPERWRFVRIVQAEQEQALLQQLGVLVIPNGQGDYEHNAALLIFDHSGQMVRIFDMEEHQLALDYARHLAHNQQQETAL